MPPPVYPRNPQPKVAALRQTEPQGFSPYAQGGYSVIPRRGTNYEICDRASLGRTAIGSPLRLLKILPDISPAVGLALWNAKRLCCMPGDVKIEAVRLDDGQTDDTEESGTAALNDLWARLPSEIGGLNGLLGQLVIETLLTGLPCVEAVPGKRLTGVAEVWPVDSLSIHFKRDKDTGRAVPLQRQYIPKPDQPRFQGYAELDTETFFWHGFDSMVDEPYGRAPYAPAIAEVLADVAMMKDLRDAMHNAAWPRFGIGFDFAESRKVAVESFAMTEETEIDAFVQARFDEAVQAVRNLKPDDSFFYDSSGKGGIQNLTPGEGFQAIKAILEFLQARLVQSLKSLPSIMGIALGSTETYGSIQWKLYALGLESIRDAVVDGLLIPVANLHLRLLGMPLKAVARIERIQTGEALVDAQTEYQKLTTEKEYVRLGMKTADQASMACTGQGIQDPSKAANFDVQTVKLSEREQVGDKKAGGSDDSGD